MIVLDETQLRPALEALLRPYEDAIKRLCDDVRMSEEEYRQLQIDLDQRIADFVRGLIELSQGPPATH